MGSEVYGLYAGSRVVLVFHQHMLGVFLTLEPGTAALESVEVWGLSSRRIQSKPGLNPAQLDFLVQQEELLDHLSTESLRNIKNSFCVAAAHRLQSCLQVIDGAN